MNLKNDFYNRLGKLPEWDSNSHDGTKTFNWGFSRENNTVYGPHNMVHHGENEILKRDKQSQ